MHNFMLWNKFFTLDYVTSDYRSHSFKIRSVFSASAQAQPGLLLVEDTRAPISQPVKSGFVRQTARFRKCCDRTEVVLLPR